jgi:hypothetical protein
MKKIFFTIAACLLMYCNAYSNGNPFTVELEEVTIPAAPTVHSFAFAQLNGKWLIIGGRTNGLHGFTPQTAFPRQFANKFVYVIDPNTNQVWSRNLFTDLSIASADPLRSTNTQFAQVNDKLYITGGYGLDSALGSFVTFQNLYVIDINGIMQAVMNNTSMASSIKQVTDSRMQVTGGEMEYFNGSFYLFGGHRFTGTYFATGQGNNNQQYTNQLRKFQVQESGSNVSITNYTAVTDTVNFHRRDMNMFHGIKPDGSEFMVVHGGVFRYDKDLPYRTSIFFDNSSYSVDSYEQKMNQYTTAHMVMFDSVGQKLHTTYFGGLSLYYYDASSQSLKEDTLVPFIKDIALITRAANNTTTETILPVQMPDLLGTNAQFIINKSLPLYNNDVIKLNRISSRTMVGYIFGGIKASLPNVTPSVASDKIYKVFITPKTIGITPVSNTVPSVFNLAQNYPNPFNPSTRIRFDVAGASPVRLAVYNALGEEVSVIVNSNLPAGTYELTFDANSLPDGVYFYRLEAGAFSETKKMLLLK